MGTMNTVDEVLEVAAQILVRCTVMGVVVLLFWWGVLQCAGELAYNAHAQLAPMTQEQFQTIHYVGMLTMKGAVALLFFFPYVAIRMVIKKRKKQSSSQPSE